jgi:hypothetical protein
MANLTVSWKIVTTNPTSYNHVATKQYVDNTLSSPTLQAYSQQATWADTSQSRNLWSSWSMCYISQTRNTPAWNSQTCTVSVSSGTWSLNASIGYVSDNTDRITCYAICARF